MNTDDITLKPALPKMRDLALPPNTEAGIAEIPPWSIEIDDDSDDCQFSAKVQAIRHQYGYAATPTIPAVKDVYRQFDPDWIDGSPDVNHLPIPAYVEAAFGSLGFKVALMPGKTPILTAFLVNGHYPTVWTWIWANNQWFCHEMVVTACDGVTITFWEQQRGRWYSVSALDFFGSRADYADRQGPLQYAGMIYVIDRVGVVQPLPTDGLTQDYINHVIDYLGALWGMSLLLRSQPVGQRVRDAIVVIKQALAIP